MADVWTGLVEGILAFGQTRAANLLGTSFHNTGAFVGALAEDRAITPDVKSKFEQLKDDIENGVAAVEPIVDKVQPKITAAATAAENMATELDTTPFTLEAAARAATELAFVLIAVDEALLILAEELSKDADGNVQPAIKTAIEGISEPWKKPFRDLGAGAAGAFDDVASELLGIEDASDDFADVVSFHRAEKELRLEFARSGRRELGALALEDVTLVGFLNYKESAVEVRTHTTPVTAWQPGDPLQRRPPVRVDPTVPLDEVVEKEAVVADHLGLRERAEAGAYLVELLEDAGMDARAALVEACPLSVEPAPDDADIAEQVAVPDYLHVLSTAVPDGVAAADALEAGDPAWLAGASEAGRAAADEWLRWFRRCVVPDAGTDSWIAERFEYRFSVRVGSGDDQAVLSAPLHEGGTIDWYSFDYAPRRGLTLDSDLEGEGVGQAERFVMIATPLRFAGMPADRYWKLEDGEVHLGRLDAQPHDLARLCVAEFAMVYGDDWIVVPLTVRGGSLTRIDEVAYTTTFGERFVVSEADDRRRSGRFRMFAISHQGAPDRTFPGLLVPPTALGVIEGRPLEDVAFLRDEMANMAWAVERTVQSRSGETRSRGDEERPVNRVEELEAGAELQYLLRTEVPKHWIPFVPISTGIGQIKLRKGTMAEEDLSLGVLLNPTPMTVEDEEVPREGLRVRRVPALARGTDGRYLRWITRRVSVGRGEGWSGLAFDGAYRP